MNNRNNMNKFQTFIRRSRRASKPASVHIAFISAPENSSLVITNSSKLTSSANVILDVCILISKHKVIQSHDQTEYEYL